MAALQSELRGRDRILAFAAFHIVIRSGLALSAVGLLAEGRSVTDAGLDAGYASLSAFIAAFKRTFGCTPGKL